MKKLFLILAVAMTSSASCYAKHVVKVTTSCGEEAYIDLDRKSMPETLEQIEIIDEVLCGEN